MIDQKDLVRTFAVPLKIAGFRKNGRTWLLKGEEVTCKVNLQKSMYGNLYFVNINFYLNKFVELDPEDGFHLVYRAENLFPKQHELIRSSCYLEELSSPALLEQLGVFLEKEMVPFLLACQDIDYLRKQLESGRLDSSFVTFKARSFLLGMLGEDR